MRADVSAVSPRAARRAALLAWLALGVGDALAQDEADEAAAPAVDAEAVAEEPVEAGGAAALETDPAADSAPAAGEEPLPVTRFEAELAFDRLVAVEDYDAAVAVGERMLELTADEFGADSIEAAKAHAALGAAQRNAGRFEPAVENYLQAVELVRAARGPYAEQLIGPLVGLGDTYQADEEHLNAVSAYNEARSASRRENGLLNEDQIAILDRMTESFYELGELEQASEQQLAALHLIERVYEPHSPEVLEATYKYAAWLRRNGNFTAERDHYMRAMRTIRDHYGDDDPLLAEPLRRIGNSYRLQRTPHGQGSSSLTQALEILSAQEDPDPLMLATVLRDIGDWEIAFTNVGASNAQYRRAWELLGEVERGDALREDWFQRIHYVLHDPHSTRGLSVAPGGVPGNVVVEFDIDEQGRTDNVVLIESDPPGFKDEAFLRHVRRSRFRPQMADGVVVPARRSLRLTFRYAPEELEEDD